MGLAATHHLSHHLGSAGAVFRKVSILYSAAQEIIGLSAWLGRRWPVGHEGLAKCGRQAAKYGRD